MLFTDASPADATRYALCFSEKDTVERPNSFQCIKDNPQEYWKKELLCYFNGNSIFLPAAGYRKGISLNQAEQNGLY